MRSLHISRFVLVLIEALRKLRHALRRKIEGHIRNVWFAFKVSCPTQAQYLRYEEPKRCAAYSD